jgi:hypothetical protein
MKLNIQWLLLVSIFSFGLSASAVESQGETPKNPPKTIPSLIPLWYMQLGQAENLYTAGKSVISLNPQLALQYLQAAQRYLQAAAGGAAAAGMSVGLTRFSQEITKMMNLAEQTQVAAFATYNSSAQPRSQNIRAYSPLFNHPAVRTSGKRLN